MRVTSSRALSALALTIGASVILTSGVAVAQEASPAAAGAKVTMWGWPTLMTRSLDAEGQDILVQRVKDELGIDLEVSLVEQPDLGAKLKAALPAGTGPDILATEFDVMGPYWGYMDALDDRAAAEWGADWRDNFSGSALSEMDLVSDIAGKSGQALYLPGNLQLLGWAYYNQHLFEQAGIDPASLTSFDDVIAACQAFKAAGIQPAGHDGHPAGLVDLFNTFVEASAPGRLALAQRGQASFTEPEVANAFDMIATYFTECAQEGALGSDRNVSVYPVFFQDGLAMTLQFTGTPWLGYLNDPDPKTQEMMKSYVGTFLFPGSKGLAATDAGLGIVSTSQNKDAAWEVIKWFVAGAEAERKAAGGEPMAWSAYRPPTSGTAYDTNLQQPLLDALATGDNVFRRILCPDVYQALTTTIPGVITAQIDSATAAQEVQDAFDRGCQDWVAA